MNKARVVSLVVEKLRAEIEVALQAAKEAHERHTHPESQARSQYDTFALEASYLAHGQSKRVEELKAALGRYLSLPLRTFQEETPIGLSALVTLESEEGEKRHILLGPTAGGLKVVADGKTVVLVTPSSPLGEALLSKTVGDSVEVLGERSSQTFEIVTVQ
jgi:transcription elongation GreA/GreB family factor